MYVAPHCLLHANHLYLQHQFNSTVFSKLMYTYTQYYMHTCLKQNYYLSIVYTIHLLKLQVLIFTHIQLNCPCTISIVWQLFYTYIGIIQNTHYTNMQAVMLYKHGYSQLNMSYKKLPNLYSVHLTLYICISCECTRQFHVNTSAACSMHFFNNMYMC